MVAHLQSESVTEPNEEPTEVESLKWMFVLEHDGGEAMTSPTDALVRLLLESGSGVSACSPHCALRVKTLTESSVRARSATGQVTKSLGKKTVTFNINGTTAGVKMEVLNISKPILSAGKMEAEDLGHEELDESMPELDVAPRGVAFPETPSQILQDAREKEVTKLQQFDTYEEVPQAEAEGQEVMS